MTLPQRADQRSPQQLYGIEVSAALICRSCDWQRGQTQPPPPRAAYGRAALQFPCRQALLGSFGSRCSWYFSGTEAGK